MIRYQPVFGDEALSLTTDRRGFVRAYQEAFGGPPYFESYSEQDVLDEVWFPHLQDGIIILALDDELVIGFGCALPLTKAPADVATFLAERTEETELPTDLSKVWYMSELGVLESYRRRGIGYSLVRHRLLTINHRGGTHYAFRTAAVGSNSIHLYRKVGARELTELQDVSTSEQVVVNGSHSTARVYLHGDCESALRALPMAA